VNTAELAKRFGIDGSALEALVAFLRDRISTGCPEFPELPAEQQMKIVNSGIAAWHERSTRIHAELALGQSDWAKAARSKIASDVWHAARDRAGLPN
jgi:hypothetical protein